MGAVDLTKLTPADALRIGDEYRARGEAQIDDAVKMLRAQKTQADIDSGQSLMVDGNQRINDALRYYVHGMALAHPEGTDFYRGSPVLSTPLGVQSGSKALDAAFKRGEAQIGVLHEIAKKGETAPEQLIKNTLTDLQTAQFAANSLRTWADGDETDDPARHGNAAYIALLTANAVNIARQPQRGLSWTAPTTADGVPEVHSVALDAIDEMQHASRRMDAMLASNPPSAAEAGTLNSDAGIYHAYWKLRIDAATQIALGGSLAIDAKATRADGVAMEEAARAAIKDSTMGPAFQIATSLIGQDARPIEHETPEDSLDRLGRAQGNEAAMTAMMSVQKSAAASNAMWLRFFDAQKDLAAQSPGFDASYADAARASIEASQRRLNQRRAADIAARQAQVKP